MKILMLCDFYNETLEFQENLLAKYYAKHGHQVVVVTSTYESVFDYYADIHDNSVPSRTYYDGDAKVIKLRYRYNILNRLRAFPSIKNILEQEKPDLIFLHGVMPNMLEAVAYKKKHSDCVLIFDSHADFTNSAKNWIAVRILHGIIRKWFLDRARKYLSRIFAVVPATATFLNEVYKVPYEEIELLPLGADMDLGREVLNSGKLQDLRKKYGILDQSRVIVTGGKLNSLKKTDLLIRVFNRMGRADVHLLIIGDTPEHDHEYKERLRKDAGDNKKIHFTGWLSTREVYEHYAISDVAVFPASQSILWQQAIAMGLPLIVGKAYGQSIEYLNLYENIISLEEEDIREEIIHEKIEQVLNDDSVFASMKEGALKVADERLNWNRLIEKTLRFNRENKGE